MGKETFEQFLKANMSWHDYEHLHEYLSESRHYVTKLINKPERGTIKDLIIIEMLLVKWDKKLDRRYLTDVWNFGLQEKQMEVIK
jgi:hypothetical protein